MEEIRGQQPGCLSTQETSPTGVRSTWCGADAVVAQDPPDRAQTHAVAESDQFTLDPAVPPTGVFSGQANNQLAEFAADWAAAGPAGTSPFLRDQVAVPGQQCAWCDDSVQNNLRGSRRVSAARIARSG